MQIAISQKVKNEIKDYFYITLGLLIYTFGWTIFLLPYQIVTGGVTGIAAVIFYGTGQDAGVKTAMSKPSITNCPNTFFIIVHSFNCIFSSLSCFACVQIRHTPLSGGYCGEVPPLPIPNREVKLTCADGTAMQCGRVGSRLLLSKPQISKDF